MIVTPVVRFVVNITTAEETVTVETGFGLKAAFMSMHFFFTGGFSGQSFRSLLFEALHFSSIEGLIGSSEVSLLNGSF